VLIHRGPAVDEAHQIEGPPQHLWVGAHADRRGVRDVGAIERLDDAPLAQDALVPVGRRALRWHPDDAAVPSAPQFVDDVLGAAGQKLRLQLLTRAR